MSDVPWAALDGRRRPLPVCCNPVVEFSIDAITTTHAADCPANTDPGSDAGVKARLDTATLLVSALADLGIRMTQVVETRPGERTVILPPDRRPNQKENTP